MVRWPSRGTHNDGAASWTDARPSDGEGSGRTTPEERLRRRRIRARLLGLLFGLAFLAGSAAALFAEGGFLDRVQAEDALRAEQDELFERAARIRRLRAEVAELHRGERSMERIAREDLGMVREGEVTFLLTEDDGLDAAADPGRP